MIWTLHIFFVNELKINGDEVFWWQYFIQYPFEPLLLQAEGIPSRSDLATDAFGAFTLLSLKSASL